MQLDQDHQHYFPQQDALHQNFQYAWRIHQYSGFPGSLLRIKIHDSDDWAGFFSVNVTSKLESGEEESASLACLLSVCCLIKSEHALQSSVDFFR
jgi:hypothetical protein